MYSLKVIAHSASKKSILASVSKKTGMFVSIVATGNIRIDNTELPPIGSVHELPTITKVSVEVTTAEENGQNFNWLVLE